MNTVTIDGVDVTDQIAIEQITFAPEETKPLKLSEALRIGSMTTEQAFGAYEEDGKYCAIGTAAYILDVEAGDLEDLLNGSVEYPCEHGFRSSVAGTIIHLNDKERWGRNQIADWLETLGL